MFHKQTEAVMRCSDWDKECTAHIKEIFMFTQNKYTYYIYKTVGTAWREEKVLTGQK